MNIPSKWEFVIVPELSGLEGMALEVQARNLIASFTASSRS